MQKNGQMVLAWQGQAKRTHEPVFAKAESKGVDEAGLSIWMSFN